MRLKNIVVVVAMLACNCLAGAQVYPTKPVTMIVPFPASGPTDTVARIVAAPMSKSLGQTVIVENVGGAGGTIGVGRVVAAPSDGYTILPMQIGISTAPSLYRTLKYDVNKDLEPIGLVTEVPMTLIARPTFPPKAINDKLVAALQAALRDDGVRARFAELGTAPEPVARQTPDALRTYLAAEINKWAPIIKKVGVYAH